MELLIIKILFDHCNLGNPFSFKLLWLELFLSIIILVGILKVLLFKLFCSILFVRPIVFLIILICASISNAILANDFVSLYVFRRRLDLNSAPWETFLVDFVDYDVLVDDYIDHHNSFISLDAQTWREARHLDASSYTNSV